MSKYQIIACLGDTAEKRTHHVTATFIQDGFSPSGDLCCNILSPCFQLLKSNRHEMFQHCMNSCESQCACRCNVPISSPSSVFWPYVHPVGLLPRSEGSDDVTLAATTHIPGAASAQRWYVRDNSDDVCGSQTLLRISKKVFESEVLNPVFTECL